VAGGRRGWKLSERTFSSSTVDLSHFQNREYKFGRSLAVRIVWFLLGQPLLRSSVLPSSSLRRALLRLFGAAVGEGAVIKPGVRVKYPWKLKVGKHCWLGEDAWIDNVAPVILGDNVCISQGVYLCTGNHDWRDPAFGLIALPISIQDGAWVAARASVAPGVVIGCCAVVGFGAVVIRNIPAREIHSGNPAVFIRHREIAAGNEPAPLSVGEQNRQPANPVFYSTDSMLK
jgi:putative colanic acid biosynthesis acetyltransferase WcaF